MQFRISTDNLVKLLSRVWLFVIPWTVAYQAPLSMEFSKQEYWSGLPFPSPWDLPDPGIKPGSPALQADSLPTELLINFCKKKKKKNNNMELLNCASESKPSLQNLSSRGNHLLTFWLPSFSLSARTHTWQIVTYNLLSKSEYRRSQLLVVFFFFSGY